MNYGLWDDTTTTMIDANKKLIQFVFDKGNLNNKNLSILDVGCGYGEQDIEWSTHLDPTSTLKAIDISDKQIYAAMEKNSNVTFDICDAEYIGLKYKHELFDRITSVESAFHYPNRKHFFNQVNSLLKPNGKFIITDIMLTNNNSKINRLFLYIFSDFLCIPKQNLISADEWDQQLASELNVEESIDITEKTFKPYYTNFMTNYAKNKNWSTWVSNTLISFFCSNQPFIYKVVVCSKKI
jgi:cyclopropane fatty-acyl-phospholipid synthase-like methyltransferase